MKIRTSITDLLNIDLPIIGAPLFLISNPDLVVAVSEAGGIGTFPTMNYRTIEELRDALQEIRSRTNKPIGANIILYKEHNPNWAKQLEVCLEEKVQLLITSMGTPRTIVREARSLGVRVFCDVITMRQARMVAKSGADALIAVSQGAGGHAGTINPFSFVPYLKKETGLPIVAAGAISRGGHMAAAFSLGADAVYVGTRFIATPEARAHSEYKQMLIDAIPEEIIYTDRISGIHANWLQKSIEKIENPPPAHAGPDADSDANYKRWRDIWSAGQGVAQIDEILPVSEIMRRMVHEYGMLLKNFPSVEV